MATYNKAEQGVDTNFRKVKKTNNMSKKHDVRDIAVLVSATPSEETIEDAVVKETMASLGAATGAASGAVSGGAIGWLAGMSLLAISDVGPLTWAGPIMAAVAGFAAGGLFGWLGGSLIGTFIPDLDASRYTESIKEEGILLSEHRNEGDWDKKGNDRLMEGV